MEDLERQKEHFNSISEEYRVARSHENHLKLKRLMWDCVFRDSPWLKEGARVLEPMCGFCDGNKIVSNYLTEFSYEGFDYSDEVVRTVKESRPDLNVWHQDVTTFSKANAYDVVILIGGLHHVPSFSSQVVANLYQSLKNGGVFVNLEPTHGNRIFKMVRERIYKKNKLFDSETERAFAVSELKGMFEGAGFECEDIMYPGLISYVLYYNPDAFPGLNIGSSGMVEALWKFERPWLRATLAKWFSFCTLSVWRKR